MSYRRRRFIQTAGAAGAFGLAGCLGNGDGNGGNGNGNGNGGTTGNGNGGSPSEVTLGTVTPLSGPFALDGTLTKQGVDYAAQEINENGGIEALDGAEINVVSEDTGETTDSATSAAQDLYSAHDPSATIGSWLSSQTLATTSVSEREGVPQLTLSYSDQIVERGYEYVFQTVPKSSEFGQMALDLSVELAGNVGSEINEIAMVGDNTAAITFTFDPLREEIIPNTEGVEIVVDEVWSPTLSDATPIVRQLQEEEPDVMFFGATAFPDSIAVLRKMDELDVQLPMIGIGAWLTLPAYIDNVGVDLTEGLMAVTGGHPLAGQEEQVRNFNEFADEPFMIQDSIVSYANTYIVKEAIEQSGSTDPQVVRDTISDIELTEGPAVESFPIDAIRFLDNGHMENAQGVLTQWQPRGDADYIGTEAAPFTVFPEDYAVRDVEWTPPEY
jgi:branched-chain amino acid transport system substrate-binding protein